MPLGRKSILEALVASLEPLPYTVALYEGGAAAWGRVDAWSDIDLYLVVEDDRVEDAMREVEAALVRIARIEQKLEAPHPPASGIAQAFYRLEGAGPFLLVDIEVLKRSAPNKDLEPELHGDLVFLFNKGGAISPAALDRVAFEDNRRERLARLQGRHAMFHAFVEKEMHRGNWIEAIDLYRTICLNPLLEVLRMKHAAHHYGFRTRYVHAELPADVVSRFQHLAFVENPDDLAAKYPQAIAWFQETVRELEAAESA